MSRPRASTAISTASANPISRVFSALSRQSGATEPVPDMDEARTDSLRDLRTQTAYECLRTIQNSTAAHPNSVVVYKCIADGCKLVKKDHSALSDSRAREVYQILRQVMDAGGHEHIATVFDAEPHQEAGSALCLQTLSRFCGGGDLQGLRTRHKKAGFKIDEAVLWQVGRQLCSAMAWLHDGPGAAAGGQDQTSLATTAGGTWLPILHCDIKPENVLLRADPRGKQYAPRVYLADFDLAVHGSAVTIGRNSPIKPAKLTPQTASEHRDSSEGSEEVRGVTEAYAAPEYPAASTKTDVWGIGATLYYLADGHPPRSNLRKVSVGAASPTAPAAAPQQTPVSPAGAQGANVADSRNGATSLDERLPLDYDCAKLERRQLGFDYTSGHCSRAFAQLVGMALERDAAQRPEARELLAAIQKEKGEHSNAKVHVFCRNIYDTEWQSKLERKSSEAQRKSAEKEAKNAARRASAATNGSSDVKGKGKTRLAASSEEEERPAELGGVMSRSTVGDKRRISTASELEGGSALAVIPTATESVCEHGGLIMQYEPTRDAAAANIGKQRTTTMGGAERPLAVSTAPPHTKRDSGGSKDDSAVAVSPSTPVLPEQAGAAPALGRASALSQVQNVAPAEQKQPAPERRSKVVRALRAGGYAVLPPVSRASWYICPDQELLGYTKRVKMVYAQGKGA